MRVLHVVKTAHGGQWAAWLAGELVRHGVEVHVAIPQMDGLAVGEWREAGAILHVAPLDFPARAPWRLAEHCRIARALVGEVRPDLIHSHFVGTTLVLRFALGKSHPIPRIFQVAGPLHLEHSVYRRLELSTAGESDVWVASSKCILGHYERARVPQSKLFLSYYGHRLSLHSRARNNALRNMLGIRDDQLVVGNVNWMYPPKYYLGQRVGLKCHEDVIDALGIVTRERADVVGVLVGGAWGAGGWYEERLRARARKTGGDRIKMPGVLAPALVRQIWPDFDCAVHVPLSENCGGALEPLAAGVPTIAARVGGLPELVCDGVTGKVVEPRQPLELASAILEVLGNLGRYRTMAETGRKLVNTIFDLRRTSDQMYRIYRHLLDSSEPRPDVSNTSEPMNWITPVPV